MGRNKKDFKTKKTHMSIRIDFDEEAIKEMSMAKEWYNGQAIGLWNKFFDAIEKAVSKISTFPLQFPITNPPFRECNLVKFPFTIVYKVRKENVIIYSVFHTKQNPKKKITKS